MARLDLELNGVLVTPPKEWTGINVLMTWDNGSAQANITTENFTLLRDASQTVYNWFEDGLMNQVRGYFQGIPAKISVSEGSGSKVVFDGFTDNKTFVDKTTNDTNRSLECEIGFKQNDQIINFKERAEGLTFDIVRNENFLTVPMIKELLYVTQKPFDALELFATSLQIGTLTLQLISKGKSAAQLVIDALAHATGGLTGIAAGAIYTAGTIALEIITLVSDLIILVQQINNLLRLFLPMPKKVGVVSLFDLASSACSYLGYNFESSITQLKEWHILPSLTQVVNNNPFAFQVDDKGYFTQSDNGFIVGDFFRNIEKIFGAKFQIIDGVANFESLINDDYWLNPSTSTYEMPDVFIGQSIPNGSEINSTIFASFADDNLDEWTRQELEGTFATEVIEHISSGETVQDQLSGIVKLEIPYALGVNKETLNIVERTRNLFSNLLAGLGSIFGAQPSALNQAFNNITNALKISQGITSVPKLLALEDASVSGQPFKVLKTNHRQELRAKTILDFNAELSPVRNNFRNQWRIYNNIEIPFGFSDFLTVSGNNYFKDTNGDTVRIDSNEWEIDSDTSVANFRIRKPYDKNLKSTIFEGNK
jgi:hypothetical protein